MITFDSVTKSFGDEGFVLRDISFSVQPGELIVITGPSGSGKTTLMRLLTKEYEPTEGEIVFDDTPLSQLPKSQIHHHRRKIGVVFQDYKLIPDLNVWENIALSLNIIGQKQAEIEQRVTDLLHLISLENKAFLFPSQLSGGEAQRVSIARALATAPALIFADEPTGNLDSETSAAIARLLQKINKLGTTVMIATHDVNVLGLLTNERHLRIEQGKLVKDTGTHLPAKTDKKTPKDNHQLEKHLTSATKPEVIPVEKLEEEVAPTGKKGFRFALPKLFGKKPATVEPSVETLDSPTVIQLPGKVDTQAKAAPNVDQQIAKKPSKTAEEAVTPLAANRADKKSKTDIKVESL